MEEWKGGKFSNFPTFHYSNINVKAFSQKVCARNAILGKNKKSIESSKSSFIFALIMEEWELDFEWLRVRHFVQARFNRGDALPDLNAIL